MKRRTDGATALPDREALTALAQDPRLEELGCHVPPLSVPRAFGVARDEVAHLRVPAEILEPGRYAGSEEILRPLVREVSCLLVRRADG